MEAAVIILLTIIVFTEYRVTKQQMAIKASLREISMGVTKLIRLIDQQQRYLEYCKKTPLV